MASFIITTSFHEFEKISVFSFAKSFLKRRGGSFHVPGTVETISQHSVATQDFGIEFIGDRVVSCLRACCVL